MPAAFGLVLASSAAARVVCRRPTARARTRPRGSGDSQATLAEGGDDVHRWYSSTLVVERRPDGTKAGCPHPDTASNARVGCRLPTRLDRHRAGACGGPHRADQCGLWFTRATGDPLATALFDAPSSNAHYLTFRSLATPKGPRMVAQALAHVSLRPDLPIRTPVIRSSTCTAAARSRSRPRSTSATPTTCPWPTRPGVARVCTAIAEDPSLVRRLHLEVQRGRRRHRRHRRARPR